MIVKSYLGEWNKLFEIDGLYLDLSVPGNSIK